MAELENIKRILADDFSNEDRDLINRLAGVLNPFMEQVIQAFDGQVNFDNLNQQLQKVTVKVNSSGTPTVGSKIKFNVTGRFNGAVCINARNLDTPTNYATTTPFLSTTTENNIMTVNNITGLTADERYELTLIIFGT